MIDELRLNTKLIGFDGVIGRRDFCFNIVILCMITTLVMIPFTICFTTNLGTLGDYFALNKFFWNSSFFVKFWTIAGTLGVAYVAVSNIIRRLNDIKGEVNKNFNTAIASLYVIATFSFIFPFFIAALLYIATTVLLLVLMCTKGKITGKLPYDFRKDFNWGAFFGTWIWGLINKSYKTLWIWLLGWTPIGFYYQILCGLKGNEWAYKNRKWNDDTEFKRSQERQTIGFVVLTVFVFPFLIFLIIMSMVLSVALLSVNEAKTSPDGNSQTMSKIEKVLDSYSSLYFESHKILENENQFYVLPKDWNGYSFSEKKDILDMAATTAATERSKGNKHSSKSKELPRTKIYSSTTHQLLGEFVMDEELFEAEKPDFKKIITSSFKTYRFYKAAE